MVKKVRTLWHSIRRRCPCRLYCHTVTRHIKYIVLFATFWSIVPSKRVLHRGRSVVSYFSLPNDFLSKSLSSSCLCLLPRPYLPSFIPSVFKGRSVHSPIQSQCSTDVDLLLRISISRIISLSKRLSSSCLRLLLHPHPPSIFPSVCYESWTTVHSKTSSPQRSICCFVFHFLQ